MQAALLDFEIGKPVPLKNPRFVWTLGNLSLAGFEVELSRHRSRHIMHNHMTSGLFVCISWISFVIPTEAIPGRMALLVTLLLVLVNIFNSSTDSQPPTDTITAASGVNLHTKPYPALKNIFSAWILSCIFLVFGALIAYATLLYIKYWSDEVKTITVTPQGINLAPVKVTKEQMLKVLNMRFLIVLVMVFLLFNLVYWPMMLSV